MSVLTWRNVDAPDLRGAIDGIRTFGDLLGKGTDAGSLALGNWDDAITDNDSRQFMTKLLTQYQGNPDQLNADLASGKLMQGYDPSNLSDEALALLNNRPKDLQAYQLGDKQIIQTDANTDQIRANTGQIQETTRGLTDTNTYNKTTRAHALSDLSLTDQARPLVAELIQSASRLNPNDPRSAAINAANANRIMSDPRYKDLIPRLPSDFLEKAITAPQSVFAGNQGLLTTALGQEQTRATTAGTYATTAQTKVATKGMVDEQGRQTWRFGTEKLTWQETRDAQSLAVRARNEAPDANGVRAIIASSKMSDAAKATAYAMLRDDGYKGLTGDLDLGGSGGGAGGAPGAIAAAAGGNPTPQIRTGVPASQAGNFYGITGGVVTHRPGEDRGDHVHQGTDIAGIPVGSQVVMPKSGVVVRHAANNGKAGNMLVVRYDDGTENTFMHLQAFHKDFPVGHRFDAGQAVAFAGNSGNASTKGTNQAVLHVQGSAGVLGYNAAARTNWGNSMGANPAAAAHNEIAGRIGQIDGSGFARAWTDAQDSKDDIETVADRIVSSLPVGAKEKQVSRTYVLDTIGRIMHETGGNAPQAEQIFRRSIRGADTGAWWQSDANGLYDRYQRFKSGTPNLPGGRRIQPDLLNNLINQARQGIHIDNATEQGRLGNADALVTQTQQALSAETQRYRAAVGSSDPRARSVAAASALKIRALQDQLGALVDQHAAGDANQYQRR